MLKACLLLAIARTMYSVKRLQLLVQAALLQSKPNVTSPNSIKNNHKDEL
jgi:hypothetical protein